MDVRKLTAEDSAALTAEVGKRMGLQPHEVAALGGQDRFRYFSAIIDAAKAHEPRTPTLDQARSLGRLASDTEFAKMSPEVRLTIAREAAAK